MESVDNLGEMGETVNVAYEDQYGDYSQGKNLLDVIVPSVSFSYLF